jgi:TolA-binding protein
MFRTSKFAVTAAIVLAAASVRAAPSTPKPPAKSQPPANRSQRVTELWDQEGKTLRDLVATTAGQEKGEALLRLGTWERQSAQRLRTDIEEGRLASNDGEARISSHLDAAVKALTEAEPLAAPDRLPQVLFSLGDLYRYRGDPKNAKVPLEKLVEAYPTDPLAVDGAIALGDDAFDAGSLAEAMRRYEFAANAATGNGPRAYAKYKLAWCHLNLDEHDVARGLFLEVVSLTGTSGKMALADEARRDYVLGLARDPSLTAADAERQIRALALAPDRTRRYLEGYAKIIAGSGRDDEAMQVFRNIEAGALPADAVRIFTAELEIAIRHRDLPTELRSAVSLANVVNATSATGESRESAERALRVAAVTVHGEARARGDTAMLNTAVELYTSYFLAFDSDPAAYELHHHAGELLASLKQPAEAERHYTASVERDLARLEQKQPPGKWLESSANGAVTNAQDALPKIDAPAHSAITEDEDVDHAPPQPSELTSPERTFVAACERYLRALPTGSQAVEVRYQRALTLFRHNQLDEAIPELRQVASKAADQAPAVFAAQLSLEGLRSLGQYDELAQLAAEYLQLPPLAEKIGADLQSMREASLLASAERESKHHRYAAAAKRYLDFARAFPKSSRLDRALYNAAAALVQDGHLAEGVAVRERLLKELPTSSLAPRARERQLAELLLLGRFNEGLRVATQIVDDTKGTEAETKLREAIVLAEAAGDVRHADTLRETYLKKFPKGSEAMTYALALIDRSRGCESSAKTINRALSIAADLNWRTIFLSRLAERENGCRKEDLARRHAAEAAAAGPKLKNARPEALDASAEAALILTRHAVEEFQKVPLREPYEKTLPKKLSALKLADDKLAQVIARGRAAPAVCALVASGQAYADLAKALNNAQAPRRYNEEQRELFKEQLAEKSQPLFDRAKTTLMEAITRAREAAVSPNCLNEGRKTLASLWPERFGARDEAVLALGPNLEPASETAVNILDRAPDAPPAWLLAAKAELAAGHPQAAIVLVNRLSEDDHLYPEGLEVKARALETLGKTDTALALWLRLAKEHPSRPLARRILADRAMESRDLEAARDHLLALQKIDAKDPAVALNLGVVLRGLGDIEGAEKTIRSAAQLAPDRLEVSLNLGLLLCGEGGRPDEGVKALEKFITGGGHPPNAKGFDAALAACKALAKGAKK